MIQMAAKLMIKQGWVSIKYVASVAAQQLLIPFKNCNLILFGLYVRKNTHRGYLEALLRNCGDDMPLVHHKQ